MSAKARISAVLIAAVVLSGATLARAESAQSTQNQILQSDHKTLPWNDKSRWSLKLDMSEPPAGHGAELRDVQAGAYYHLTPSLRVGGAVSFGEQPLQPNPYILPQAQAPRVKLETSFKF